MPIARKNLALGLRL